VGATVAAGAQAVTSKVKVSRTNRRRFMITPDRADFVLRVWTKLLNVAKLTW
jgi:hypothetical protein